MRVLCLDETLRQSAALPPEFHWSNVAEHPVGDGALGAAVVRDLEDWTRLRHALSRSVFQVLPLIGLSGDLRDKVDVVVGVDLPTIAGALTALRGFIARATRLPAIFADVDDGALHLLAYLAVRDVRLAPVYTPDRPAVAHFPVQARLGDRIEFDADRLVAWELLTSHFDERINVCSACGSARVIVRELCPACRSAEIANESIIHHFRCAEEAPESHFRRGANLVCPKCRQFLRHFSVDYDKPGMVVSCASCGHLTGEPTVGFRCLDCRHADLADRLGSREVRSYALTDAGRTSIFDASWLVDFVTAEAPAAVSPEPVLKAMTAIPPRSDATVIAVRFGRHADSGWQWLRPRTQSPFDQRALELAQRLVREHFADDAVDVVDAPDGFDALIAHGATAVERQLPGLEQRLAQLVDAQVSCTVRPARAPSLDPQAQYEAR